MKREIIILLMCLINLSCSVAVETLTIGNDVIDSFEYIENNFNNKCWRSDIIVTESYVVFDSIWLTDKEYRKLLKTGSITTTYKDIPFKIEWIDFK